MAVMLIITDAPTAGFVTAYPAGTDQPFTSAVNTDEAYQIRTPTQIVPVTAQGMNVFSVAGGNIIVDVVGCFSGVSAGAGSTGVFVPATPTHILDTRNGHETYPGGAMLAATSGVTGANAQAGAANVTVTRSGPAGWVTALAAMTAQPTTPTVSYENPGMTVANLNLISVSGRVSPSHRRRVHMPSSTSPDGSMACRHRTAGRWRSGCRGQGPHRTGRWCANAGNTEPCTDLWNWPSCCPRCFPSSDSADHQSARHSTVYVGT